VTVCPIRRRPSPSSRPPPCPAAANSDSCRRVRVGVDTARALMLPGVAQPAVTPHVSEVNVSDSKKWRIKTADGGDRR